MIDLLNVTKYLMAFFFFLFQFFLFLFNYASVGAQKFQLIFMDIAKPNAVNVFKNAIYQFVLEENVMGKSSRHKVLINTHLIKKGTLNTVLKIQEYIHTYIYIYIF